MSYTESETHPVATRVDIQPVVQRKVARALYQVFIASEDEQRLEMLEKAASEQGWNPLSCQDADVAAELIAKNRVQFAIVDLDGLDDESRAGFRELAEHVATENDTLLMICGNEEDAPEEIWAREVGAWLYLPGVGSDSDVSMLCGEARDVTDKMYPHLAGRDQAAVSLS